MSRIWPGPGSCVWGDDLVAAGDDADAEPRGDTHLDDAKRQQPADILGAKHVARREQLVAHADVLADLDHVLAGATGRSTSMVEASTSWVFSTITTASAPSGSIPPVAILTVSPSFGSRVAGRPIITSSITVR